MIDLGAFFHLIHPTNQTMASLINFLPTVSTSAVLFVTSIILWVVFYVREKTSYWDKKGVPSLSAWRFFSSLFGKDQGHVTEFYIQLYRDLEGEKFGGSYQMLDPIILLRDPQLAKHFCVKAFSSFHDRMPPTTEGEDNPFTVNLFSLTGEKWRQVRNKLSPGFSTGKLKIMFQTLKEYSSELNSYLEKKVSKTGDIEIDIKELMSNYTLEVIGAVAMGIKCNAIQDPNCEFKRMMLVMLRISWRTYATFFLKLIHPKLPLLLGLSPVSPELSEFFRKVVKETMEMKDSKHEVTRKDFLQLVMNHRDSEEQMKDENDLDPLLSQDNRLPKDALESDEEGPLFSESLIMGTMVSFLSAGFEPVSSTLTCCLYELAHHPDVQEKLFNEIQAVKASEPGNEINYESMKKFKYVDQVMNETLRKHPVAGVLARVCTEPFLIPDTSVILEKGTKVYVSLHAMQQDPKYFSDPKKFDPDRFSEENVDKIIPGTYSPFGDGPRFCIGMRLATLDIKTLLITVISNFRVRTCEKTVAEIKYDKSVITLLPDRPIWLRLEKRK